jgi:predicted acyl esterase
VQIDWDVAIPMEDGVVLRADVFRPDGAGAYPVLLSHGPYAKGLAFQEGYPSAWELMVRRYPDVAANSTNRYQNWEVVDPEKWVPDGYACVRVDSRGAGRSPGLLEPWSPRETRDLAACIEWAAVQPWSSGKIGLSGISYYAMNQWQVAALAPPHLAAICAWEGAADWYREVAYHGGILSTFCANWFEMQVTSVQHGLGERGARSAVTGELVCGPATLGEEELARNRRDLGPDLLAHPLDDGYFQDRSARWEKVTVPFLSSANWGGQGLHTRGNFEAFTEAASSQKWLEVHGGEHWTSYYTDYGVQLQRRFFARFLKDEPAAWSDEPRVRLQVRHVDRFVERGEHEWPLARTRWTRYHLDPVSRALSTTAPEGAGTVGFEAQGEGVTFFAPPLERELELTGPSALTVTVSSSTADADLFVVLRVFDPAGEEVVFQGAIDPHTPIAQGWLRASHRKLDPRKSKPYRPYHAHDAFEPLRPGQMVGLEIEVWPTSIVVPPGYRLALTIRGKDYEYPGPSGGRLSNFRNELRGCGPFLHDDPVNRPPERFAGTTTLHVDGAHPAFILLPVIP